MRILLTVIFITLLSCNKEHEIKNEAIDVLIDPLSSKAIGVSKLVKSYRYVKLERVGHSVGAHANSLICGDDVFLNEFSQKVISSYDLQTGNRKILLKSLGQGPGEFPSFADFYVDNEKVYVLSRSLGKVIVYDKNGKYLKENKSELFKNSASICSYYKDSYLLRNDFTCSSIDYNFLLSTSDGDLLEKYLPLNEKWLDEPVYAYRYFTKSRGKMFMHYLNSYTVYDVTNSDSIKPYYKFDFGKYNITSDLKTKYNRSYGSFDMDDDFKKNNKKNVPFFFFQQNDNMVMINYFFGNSLRYSFYFKDDKSLLTGRKIYNDHDGLIFEGEVLLTNKYLVAIMQPYEILKQVKKIKKKIGKRKWKVHKHRNPKLKKLLSDLKRDDNPILFVGEF